MISSFFRFQCDGYGVSKPSSFLAFFDRRIKFSHLIFTHHSH